MGSPLTVATAAIPGSLPGAPCGGAGAPLAGGAAADFGRGAALAANAAHRAPTTNNQAPLLTLPPGLPTPMGDGSTSLGSIYGRVAGLSVEIAQVIDLDEIDAGRGQAPQELDDLLVGDARAGPAHEAAAPVVAAEGLRRAVRPHLHA